MSAARRVPLAVLATALSLVALGAALLAPSGDAADRAKFDTQVLALVPFPGYPARAYVHPNGRIYEGTYESDAGAGVPSRLFEYTGEGKLVRAFSIRGQTLGEPHGIQAALSDASGRMILLDTLPARVLVLDPASGRQGPTQRSPTCPYARRRRRSPIAPRPSPTEPRSPTTRPGAQTAAST